MRSASARCALGQEGAERSSGGQPTAGSVRVVYMDPSVQARGDVMTVYDTPIPGTAPKVRRAAGWLIPLAAAAAVVIAVGVGVAVPELISSPGRPAAPATGAGTPPFVLVLNRPDSRGDQGPLVVISAATGRVTGTVPDPRTGTTWDDVAVTGSGTGFVLAATPSRGGLCNPTYLYTLTLSASGAPASLRPLTDPVVPAEIGSMAASADGGTLAFVADPCRGPGQQIGIIRGSTVKTWQEPYPLVADSLSLSADGRMLGYAESGGGAGTTVRVLDTGSALGNATAAGTIVYTYPAGARGPSVTIGAGGTTMYVFWLTGPNGPHLTRTLAGYRIGPGGVQGTLFRRTLPAGLSLSQAGGQLLVWEQGVALYLVDPATGNATRVRAAWTGSWQIFW